MDNLLFIGNICTRLLSVPVTNLPHSGLNRKESACNEGDMGSIPGLGRSPRVGNGYHTSILAWRIPRTEESMGSQRVRHDWATKPQHIHWLIKHCPPGLLWGRAWTSSRLEGPVFFFLEKNIFLAVLGLHCCQSFSLVAVSQDYSSLWSSGFSLPSPS